MPAKACDCFKFADDKRPALVAGFRARHGKSFEDGRALRFVDCGGVEVPVEENHQHGVPFLSDIDLAQPLAGLAVWKDAPALI